MLSRAWPIPLFRGCRARCFARSIHSDSTDFVSRVRQYEHLKTNDLAVTEAFAHAAQFVLFLNHHPLLTVTPVTSHNQSGMEFKLKIISQADLQSCAEANKFQLNINHSALIDVVATDSGPLPLFAYGLRLKDMRQTNWDHQDESQLESRLQAALDGVFFDFRRALFTLTHQHDREVVSKSQSVLRWSRSFKFCSSCGARVLLKLSKANGECPICRQIHYPTVSPVGIVLVEDPAREHCLLVRQPRHLSGVYTAIAGFGECGETIEATVRREVAEEVGVEVDNLRYIQMSQAWPIPSCSLMFAFVATATKSLQNLDVDKTELEDARWFSREQVLAAYHNTKQLRMSNNFSNYGISTEFAYLPPKGAIAYELIRQWLKEPPHV